MFSSLLIFSSAIKSLQCIFHLIHCNIHLQKLDLGLFFFLNIPSMSPLKICSLSDSFMTIWNTIIIIILISLPTSSIISYFWVRFICLSVHLSACPVICYFWVNLFIYLFVYLSICLFYLDFFREFYENLLEPNSWCMPGRQDLKCSREY